MTHTELVRALKKPGKAIAAELTHADADLLHMAVGISGEAGELLDAVKKATIYRKEIDRANVIEELGDLEFYMEGLRQNLGIERSETIEANIRKLSKRYGSLSYSDQQAQARADKEEPIMPKDDKEPFRPSEPTYDDTPQQGYVPTRAKLRSPAWVKKFLQFESKTNTAFWSFVHANKIPHVRLGPRRILFEEAAVMAWLDSRSVGKPKLAI